MRTLRYRRKSSFQNVAEEQLSFVLFRAVALLVNMRTLTWLIAT